jgi:predicted peptidase
MDAALKAADARDARYTEFPDANHNSWDATYAYTPMWEWLFEQRRGR